MKIARVITTFKCPRSCSYCCNKNGEVISEGKEISNLVEIAKDYDAFCLTGGEPTLCPEKVTKACSEIRGTRAAAGLSDPEVFLYTAEFGLPLKQLIPHVDGVTFTLHQRESASLMATDIAKLAAFQAWIPHYKRDGAFKCSFRLSLSPFLKEFVPVVPSVWDRIECKPWYADTKCPLPPNETLFILKEN